MAHLIDATLCDPDLRGAKLSGADLSGADLRDATLCDTDLREADLRGADLTGADLPDGWTVRQWAGCGSARRMTTLAIWPGGHRVWCGCFSGSVEEFAAQVEQTHADNPTHLEDYREIVASMRRLLAR